MGWMKGEVVSSLKLVGCSLAFWVSLLSFVLEVGCVARPGQGCATKKQRAGNANNATMCLEQQCG